MKVTFLPNHQHHHIEGYEAGQAQKYKLRA